MAATQRRARQRRTVTIGHLEYTLARTRRRSPRIPKSTRQLLDTLGQRLAARITLIDPQVKALTSQLDDDKRRAREEIAPHLISIGVEGFKNTETGEGLIFKVDRGLEVIDAWAVLDAVTNADQGHTLESVVLTEAVLQALGRRGRKKVLTVIRDELKHLDPGIRAQIEVKPNWKKLQLALTRRWIELPATPQPLGTKDPKISVSPAK
jgi:hypothetical protein